MRTYIFLILLFVCSQQIHCGPLHLNSQYHSVYSYEVIVATVEDAIPKKQFSITSEFELHPTSKLTYDINLKNVASKELGDSLDQKLVEELQKKFSVTIIKLPAGEFTEVAVKFSDPKESEHVKNIKKGLVSLLSVDYRKEDTYRTTQSGLLGRCDNEYSVSRTPKVDGKSHIYITRTRLKDTCQASKRIEEIFTDKIGQEIISESKSDYYYELVETDDDVYIKNADLEERVLLNHPAFRELTSPLLSQQRITLLSREKHGSNHNLRKRQFRFPIAIPTLPSLRIPTLPPLRRPTIPSITSIFNRSKEAIDNAVHKVIDGDSTTNLEARTDYKMNTIPIPEMAEKFNRLAETLKVIESEDVEKLQLGYQYMQLKSHLFSADKQYLLDLFKSDKITADPKMRHRIFFQLLSLLPQHSAFEAAKEVMDTDQKGDDTLKQFGVDSMTVFLTSKTRMSVMENTQAKEVYQFCKESLTQNRVFLYKACYLYFSRMASMNHIDGHLALEEVDHFQKSVISDLVGDGNKLDSNTPPVKLILALKSVKNFRIPSGLDFIKKILFKPSHKHLVRVEAAWGLNGFDVSSIKDELMKALYNQSENTEIRLAIFNSLIGKHGPELIPFVTRMKLNFVKGTYIDDKRLVLKIMSVLKHAIEQPSTEWNTERQRNARILYDTIRDDYKEYLGRVSDQDYYKSLFNGAVQQFLSIIPSKNSLIPETYYLSLSDTFDNSQYILRSLHGNLRKPLFPDKSGETPDANIQDYILRMVQQLHLSLRERVEHNYAISRHQNNYAVYFIYGDENNPIYPMDLIAFKGNGVHVKCSYYAVSFTESGLPYYTGLEQLSINRLFPSSNGINLLRATGGTSKSVIFPIISTSHFMNGKVVEETLRSNIHLGFNVESFDLKNTKLNGSVSILNDGESSTSLYYKSQRFISKIFAKDKDLPSLHLNEVDQFDSENYEEVTNNHGDFHVRSRYPIGRGDDNRLGIEWLMKGFKTIGSLLCRKKYSYDLKITFEPNPPHRALVWNVDWSKNGDQTILNLILSHDSEKLYSLSFHRTVNLNQRQGTLEVESNDFKNSYKTNFVMTLQFPVQTYEGYQSKDILPFIQNATLTGSFSTSTGGVSEPYFSFNGIASKRHDKREIEYYDKYYRRCLMRRDIICLLRYYRNSYKYNRLEIDVEMQRKRSPGEFTVIDNLSAYLFEHHRSNAVMDKNKKTDSLEKTRIEINVRKDMRSYPTGDFVFRMYWGEATYKNIPATITYIFLGYSIFDYNFDIRKRLPFYDPPTCHFTKNSIETFDGNKQLFTNSKSCPNPELIVGDCSQFQFFVLHRENAITVLHNHKHNITITSSDAFVNGQKEDFQENPVKQYETFKIHQFRKKYSTFIGHSIEFGKGMLVFYFENSTIITSSPMYKNLLCGLCGNNDGDWSNDIVSSRNEPVEGDKLYETWSFGDNQCA